MSVHNTGRTFLVPLVEACLLPQGELGSSGKARVGLPQFPLCAAVSAAWPPSCSLFFASLPRLAIIAGRPFWSHASGWAMKYTVLAQETPPPAHTSHPAPLGLQTRGLAGQTNVDLRAH